MLRRHAKRAGERGQILVMFAFSMLFLIVGMIAVAMMAATNVEYWLSSMIL